MSALPASDSYGFAPAPSGSHAAITRLIGKGMKVLDVGCNKGYLCREFKNRGATVWGIEADAQAAAQAKPFCEKVVNADLDRQDSLPFDPGSFDAIVCADVLEHLSDPGRCLRMLMRYLAPRGVIIASLPNVARIDVRLALLRGRFEYAECGIMDKTHLRFFTRASALRLFEEAGLRVTGVSYTGIASRIKIFPTLFAFQFVLTGTRREGGG